MKTKVLVDVKVECEPPRSVTRYCRTVEEQARALESWARDFNDFVRDHRSQDPVDITIEREYEDQCSHCHSEWETDDDGSPLCCDQAIAEFDASKVIA